MTARTLTEQTNFFFHSASNPLGFILAYHNINLTLVASCSKRCSCSAWSRCSFLSLQLCRRWVRAACSRSSRDETFGATLWKSAPPESQLPWLPPPPPPSLEVSPCEGPRRIRWSKHRPSRSSASTGAVAIVLRRRPCSSRSLERETWRETWLQ